MPRLVLLVKHPSESELNNLWANDKVITLNTYPEVKGILEKYSLQGVTFFIQRQDSKKMGWDKKVIQAVEINLRRIRKRSNGTYDIPVETIYSLDDEPYKKSTKKVYYYWA